MRNDNNKITGKIYGIGIGPGEYKLLTLKAVETLKRVKTVFAPKPSNEGTSFARSIIKSIGLRKKRYVELPFPMIKDRNKLMKYWLDAGKKIAKEVKLNGETAFITIGDPFIYSTYIYLYETIKRNHPLIKMETIPGISSINASACAAGIPLLKGKEKLAVVPAMESADAIRKTLKEFDTIVIMKVGSRFSKVVAVLAEMNLLSNSVMISRAGCPDEKIIQDLSSLKDAKQAYLSVIIVRKNK